MKSCNGNILKDSGKTYNNEKQCLCLLCRLGLDQDN